MTSHCQNRYGPTTCIAIFLAFVIAGQTSAQDTGLRRFADWSYQDGVALTTEMGPRTGLYFVGSLAALAAISTMDDEISDGVKRRNHGGFHTFLDLTNELGGPRATPVAAGIFAISLATRNERFQDASYTSLQSLVYAGLITLTFKTVFGRNRPTEVLGPRQFDLFSGSTSFPSGHTTAAFAIVTPWVLYYRHPVSYGLFALAAGTATARVARDRHWPTDVIAGAAIGVLTARYLTRQHRVAIAGPGISLQPVLAPDETGIVLQINLN